MDTNNRIEDQTSDPRIRDGHEAWRLISGLLAEDAPRSKSRAKIRGMIDGNPPYNPVKLKAAGQGQRTNLNFREAEGYAVARRSSYYDLVMNADPLVTAVPAKVPRRVLDMELDAEMSAPLNEYGDIIAEEFHRVLTDWDGFLFHTMRHQSDMLDYGVGPVMFPDPGDWRFKSVPMGDVLVPAEAPANVDEQELVVLKSTMTVTDLYQLVSDPEQVEVSKSCGWDTGLIRSLLVKTYNTKYRAQEYTWETIQHQIKTNSLVEGSTGPRPLVLYYMFIREFSGKIGMVIVCSDRQEKRFLFRKDGVFSKFSQAMNFFFSEVGDGSYHSVRGLGQKIFPHCAVSNDFLNNLVDGGKLAASAVINQRTGASPDALKMLRVGPLTVLPLGYELADKPFNPNLQGVAAVRDILQGTLNTNVGMFRANGEGMGAKTAREVNTIVQREAQLETTDISFYYAQWDILYREMFRRLMDEDKLLKDRAKEDRREFLANCDARGVPKVLLKTSIWKISANRTSGAGSPALRDITSRAILEIAPFLDGKGKQSAIRNRLLSLVGPGNVARYQGDQGRSEMPVVNSSLARLENGLMIMGQPATAAEVEDHLAHMMIHLQGPMTLQQQLDAGGEPNWVAAAQSLSNFLQHGAEHLQFMAGNPAYQNEAAQVQAALEEQSQTLKQWQQAAQKQQQTAEQQKAQQGADALELEKIRIKTEATLQEKLIKEENMANMRNAKAEHQMELASLKTQHAMQLAAAKQGL